jgi:hypothetical protein
MSRIKDLAVLMEEVGTATDTNNKVELVQTDNGWLATIMLNGQPIESRRFS